MAAINLLPSFVNAKLLTKPCTGTSNNRIKSRLFSLNFHIFIEPSHEPETVDVAEAARLMIIESSNEIGWLKTMKSMVMAYRKQ